MSGSTRESRRGTFYNREKPSGDTESHTQTCNSNESEIWVTIAQPACAWLSLGLMWQVRYSD